MKDLNDDALLGQHLSGDPPRESLKDQTLRDSTAAFIRARELRRARRTFGRAAAAILIAGFAFLSGRFSAPTARIENISTPARHVAQSDSTTVPNELLAWLEAARLFRQLGMQDRMARAVERAGKLLPAGAFVADGHSPQSFAAVPAEHQNESTESTDTPGPHPSAQSINRILAHSFGD